MTTRPTNRRLRVLVLTNHFREFAGSEIVALQTALWFAERDDIVTLGANVSSTPIDAHATGVQITTDVADLDPSAFDLVWCQHDMLSLTPLSAWEAAAAADSIPHVACVSLSPFEPYEHLNAPLARALSADVYANSPETADVIVASNHGLVQRHDICVFFNAAPEQYWANSFQTTRPPTLTSLLLVSNHLPPELNACASLLEKRGIRVRRMGLHHDAALVAPADLQACDAVVSIGKSVVYALAQAKPIFIYDYLGGDGWLTRDNFLSNQDHNFSGRPRRRPADAESLTTKIVEGYAHAADEMEQLVKTQDLTHFHLGTHLAPLRDRALERTKTLPRALRHLRLTSHLRSSRFRAHMETARSKTEVMRRLRRQIDGSPA